MKKHRDISLAIVLVVSILLVGCVEQDDSHGEQIEINDPSNISENTEVEENTESKADQVVKSLYLEKLRMAKEQADNLDADDRYTYAMRDMESSRWEIWDDLLNEIYGDLKSMLSSEEMEALRTEQRAWIKQRDAQALEASMEYKNTTSESLHYARTLATLTEERCYELVDKYVK